MKMGNRPGRFYSGRADRLVDIIQKSAFCSALTLSYPQLATLYSSTERYKNDLRVTGKLCGLIAGRRRAHVVFSEY